jgi:hypothetical protein
VKIILYVVGVIILGITLLDASFAEVDRQKQLRDLNIPAAYAASQVSVGPGFIVGFMCICTAALMGEVEKARKEQEEQTKLLQYLGKTTYATATKPTYQAESLDAIAKNTSPGGEERDVPADSGDGKPAEGWKKTLMGG